MSLTVAGIQTEVANRVGGFLADTGLDAEDVTSSGPIRSAIRRALSWVNVVPATPGVVVDADVSVVTG